MAHVGSVRWASFTAPKIDVLAVLIRRADEAVSAEGQISKRSTMGRAN
jgi:hypothetical protein